MLSISIGILQWLHHLKQESFKVIFSKNLDNVSLTRFYYVLQYRWIGLRRKHIDNMLSLSSSHAQDVQRILQPMTDNDQSKLRSLQANPALTPTMQSEIERMAQGKARMSFLLTI